MGVALLGVSVFPSGVHGKANNTEEEPRALGEHEGRTESKHYPERTETRQMLGLRGPRYLRFSKLLVIILSNCKGS